MSQTINDASATRTLSLRFPKENPDHHLWNNHGTWWCHYTEHLADFTKRRVRRSLHTDNVGVARVLRDSILFHSEPASVPSVSADFRNRSGHHRSRPH
jgi:hypothetical protein